MKGILRSKHGAINVFVAISMVVIIGFAALAVDIGMISYNKSRLQNACDAAALAGARELPDEDSADAAVEEYLLDNELGLIRENINIRNESDLNIVEFTGEEPYRELFSFKTEFGGEEDGKPTHITVRAHEPVEYLFAKFFGNDHGTVSVASRAAANAPLFKVSGLRPFGVTMDVYEFGESVILKTGSPNGISGNFYALGLDGTGADVYKTTILNGCTSSYEVGDTVDTETGNMVGPTLTALRDLIGKCEDGCTYDSYLNNCDRVIMVPLVEWKDVNGKSTLCILGFAEFFINDVYNNAGHTEISGTFIRAVDSGETDPDGTDYGAVGVKLIPAD